MIILITSVLVVYVVHFLARGILQLRNFDYNKSSDSSEKHF